jgi:predicted cupin superfamily sugar epimerase
MSSLSVQQLVQQFQLQPHPEGGYYKETYRSPDLIPHQILSRQFKGDRAYSTAIYFLLEKNTFSAFHRIESDEVWHFYYGQTLLIYVIHLNGKLEIVRLGRDIFQGEVFQYAVPANCWFAAEPAVNSDFSFVGCTVAPGFDFADFELANPDELIKIYPNHEVIIRRLCR